MTLIGHVTKDVETLEMTDGELSAYSALDAKVTGELLSELSALEIEEDESVDVTGDEDDGEEESEQDLIVKLALGAVQLGRDFDGPQLAEILREWPAPIEDARLSIAIEVLALGRKLTGDKMLELLTAAGFASEVGAARQLASELEKDPSPVIAVSGVPTAEVEA